MAYSLFFNCATIPIKINALFVYLQTGTRRAIGLTHFLVTPLYLRSLSLWFLFACLRSH